MRGRGLPLLKGCRRDAQPGFAEFVPELLLEGGRQHLHELDSIAADSLLLWEAQRAWWCARWFRPCHLIYQLRMVALHRRESCKCMLGLLYVVCGAMVCGVVRDVWKGSSVAHRGTERPSFLPSGSEGVLECLFPFTLLLRSGCHVLPAHMCSAGPGHKGQITSIQIGSAESTTSISGMRGAVPISRRGQGSGLCSISQL